MTDDDLIEAMSDLLRPSSLMADQLCGLPHLTPTVRAIARSIYEERRLDELPVLADALEEAGCPLKSVLDELRSPLPHNWGCWATALVFGSRALATPLPSPLGLNDEVWPGMAVAQIMAEID